MKNLPQDQHPPGLHYHDLEENMFRTIHVQPGNAEDMLDIHIMLMSFLSIEDEGSKTYVPVSHRWKPFQEHVPARISGEIVMIPRNLDLLMRKARWPEGSETVRTMWIDQLCINQDDDNDKAQQVPLMRNIYERAASTIVWLGDEGIEDCGLAFDLMRKWSAFEGWQVDTLPLEQMLGPPTEENLRSFRALRSLMEYDYWDRTWVLQEATADRNTSVWYSDVEDDGFPLGLVFWARNLIMGFVARNAPPVYGLKQTPSTKVGRLELFRYLRTDGQPHSLLEILSLIRRTACSNPRDKVFSVLPFAADVGDYMNDRYLKPDYERQTFDVYMDVARWYICTKQNLDILGYCDIRMDTDTVVVPSWVPNWTTKSYLVPFPKALDEAVPVDQRQPVYSACGPFSHKSQLVFPPLEGWRTTSLFLSGLHIATVRDVLDHVSDLFMSLGRERSWQDTVDPSASYPLTDETMLVAFERTLMGDREELDDGEGKQVRRGCRLVWPDSSDSAKLMEQTSSIKRLAKERSLFYAHSVKPKQEMQKPYTEEPPHTNGEELQFAAAPEEIPKSSMIMALGRRDVRPGDEIWALKGGSVLYVLRPWGETYKANDATEQNDIPDNGNLPDQLWFNGRKRDFGEPLQAETFHFVGECYAHGLMDGEALEYAAKSEDQRPEVLRDMEGEFREILVGLGETVWQDEDKDENGEIGTVYRMEGGKSIVAEDVPAGKKAVWSCY